MRRYQDTLLELSNNLSEARKSLSESKTREAQLHELVQQYGVWMWSLDGLMLTENETEELRRSHAELVKNSNENAAQIESLSSLVDTLQTTFAHCRTLRLMFKR